MAPWLWWYSSVEKLNTIPFVNGNPCKQAFSCFWTLYSIIKNIYTASGTCGISVLPDFPVSFSYVIRLRLYPIIGQVQLSLKTQSGLLEYSLLLLMSWQETILTCISQVQLSVQAGSQKIILSGSWNKIKIYSHVVSCLKLFRTELVLNLTVSDIMCILPV